MLSVNELVDRLIDLSFAEDIGDGDHTTARDVPTGQIVDLTRDITMPPRGTLILDF